MSHLPFCAIPLNVLWMWILWFLHTRKGILSTKQMSIHLPKKKPLDEKSQRDGNVFFQFNKTVVRNDLWKEMAHMFADFFLIEMPQTT